MYFTINELNLLMARRTLAQAQERLASVRRCQGDTVQAEYEVKRMLDHVYGFQLLIDYARSARTSSKERMLERLS